MYTLSIQFQLFPSCTEETCEKLRFFIVVLHHIKKIYQLYSDWKCIVQILILTCCWAPMSKETRVLVIPAEPVEPILTQVLLCLKTSSTSLLSKVHLLLVSWQWDLNSPPSPHESYTLPVMPRPANLSYIYT